MPGVVRGEATDATVARCSSLNFFVTLFAALHGARCTIAHFSKGMTELRFFVLLMYYFNRKCPTEIVQVFILNDKLNGVAYVAIS